MANNEATTTTAPQPPTLDGPEREVPDYDDCEQVLIMNRRLGMFNAKHLIQLPPRPNEPERYKSAEVKLLPGLNFAPREWIEKLRELNPHYETAFHPTRGCLQYIGDRKAWLKLRDDDALAMVLKTGSIEVLEALADIDKREPILEALADELADRRKNNRIREDVLRAQRRAKRRKGSSASIYN